MCLSCNDDHIVLSNPDGSGFSPSAYANVSSKNTPRFRISEIIAHGANAQHRPPTVPNTQPPAPYSPCPPTHGSTVPYTPYAHSIHLYQSSSLSVGRLQFSFSTARTGECSGPPPSAVGAAGVTPPSM
ncbi:hypothetical protein PLICRDRAFT_53752 [Plicaturopsis crispa FD-325 SS-3]|nr:hypothetical protein PLICRDRAFT_53752 [Plicaturopsis crispa FD-325 SS-3]